MRSVRRSRRRGTSPTPGRPDVAPGGFPPRPDAPAPSPPRRRRRFVALALVVSLTAPGVLALVAFVPWSDGPPAYAFLERRCDGKPFRWEPCRAIHYEVNLAHASPTALADVTEAVARASRGSGIRFAFDGPTDRTPDAQEASDFRDPETLDIRPVLIAWLPSSSFSEYADPDEALGVGYGVPGSGNGYWVYETGLVVINADAPLHPGFAAPYALGPVLMHELGHVLGLGHVPDGSQIMWSPDEPGSDLFPAASVTDWGDGDLAGLQKVGRPAGCVHTPGEEYLPDEEITPSPPTSLSQTSWERSEGVERPAAGRTAIVRMAPLWDANASTWPPRSPTSTRSRMSAPRTGTSSAT